MKLKIKENIDGRITKENRNYSQEDAEKLSPLFEEEQEYIGDVGDILCVKQNRKRIKDHASFPEFLPTHGLTPYPIDDHPFIGQFESKKNLYLILAHAYNKLMRRTNFLLKEVERLTEEVNRLKNS